MNNTIELANSDAPREEHAKPARLFRATIGKFEDPADCATMDSLVRWVEDKYREDLLKRPSKHVYIRLLPEDVVRQIDQLRDHAIIQAAILRQFDASHVITPMKHTDELYISHYNKDLGGDQGLYSKHYDGNLRFLPFGAVVRSLIYLQSDATYKLVFGDSGVEQSFASYEFGLLDFHRELHWVEGEYNPDDRQRILLKCNYLIAPRHATFLARVMLDANTAVFYVVKAAMEYSKSPKNLPQAFIGLLCNVFRIMNNVHPVVPLVFIALVFGSAGWGLLRLLTH